jgi:hypothetical protein
MVPWSGSNLIPQKNSSWRPGVTDSVRQAEPESVIDSWERRLSECIQMKGKYIISVKFIFPCPDEMLTNNRTPHLVKVWSQNRSWKFKLRPYWVNAQRHHSSFALRSFFNQFYALFLLLSGKRSKIEWTIERGITLLPASKVLWSLFFVPVPADNSLPAMPQVFLMSSVFNAFFDYSLSTWLIPVPFRFPQHRHKDARHASILFPWT